MTRRGIFPFLVTFLVTTSLRKSVFTMVDGDCFRRICQKNVYTIIQRNDDTDVKIFATFSILRTSHRIVTFLPQLQLLTYMYMYTGMLLQPILICFQWRPLLTDVEQAILYKKKLQKFSKLSSTHVLISDSVIVKYVIFFTR